MTRPYFNMAICVFQGCENQGGQYNLKFTCNDTKERYYSPVPMCMECYGKMRDSRDVHGNAQLDVTYSPTNTSFLDEGFSLDGRQANVTELHFISEGGDNK